MNKLDMYLIYKIQVMIIYSLYIQQKILLCFMYNLVKNLKKILQVKAKDMVITLKLKA